MAGESNKKETIRPTELEDATATNREIGEFEGLFSASQNERNEGDENLPLQNKPTGDVEKQNEPNSDLVFHFEDLEAPPEEESPDHSSEHALASELREALPYSSEIFSLLNLMLKRSGVAARRFLEIGYGDAILSGLLLKVFPDATGVLLDTDEPSLNAAWHRLGEESQRMAFVAQDISHPEWAEAVKNVAPFDVILTSFVIGRQVDEHKVNIYSDLFEMLAPGGLFFNLDFVSISAPFARKVFESLYIESLAQFRAARTGVLDRDTAEKDFLQRPDKESLLPSQTDVQCDWLREIGFVGVDCFFRGLGIAFFGGAKPRKASSARSEQ